MDVIYEPKGKAREYAPLACNLYKGCPHGCTYCYGPTLPNPSKKGCAVDEWRKQWHSQSIAKPEILQRLAKDCTLMKKRSDRRPVMLCFACDPYPPDEPVYTHDCGLYQDTSPITRKALEIMLNCGVTPIVLTKGGTRACRDFNILKDAGGWFGQTLIGEENLRKRWEINASGIGARILAWVGAREMGIKTWASIEPVIVVEHALVAIDIALDNGCKHIKLGKLSGYNTETREIEKSIDWVSYREQARHILLSAGYKEIDEAGVFEMDTFYVKSELRDIL